MFPSHGQASVRGAVRAALGCQLRRRRHMSSTLQGTLLDRCCRLEANPDHGMRRDWVARHSVQAPAVLVQLLPL